MNEPHMAPWWFPSNDHPLDKAIVDVRIRVPRGREVISNGELKGRLVRRTSTTWHWRADEPMVPYLAFFAAGDFTISVVGGLTTALNPGFALENQTRPTYPAVGGSYTSLVVHELAHQWFGDDIAVQGWRDIWLNEGFATFMEWRWAETHGGRSAAALLRSYYDNVSATSDFWTVIVADPGAARVFDSAIYGRGGMTLQALRNRVGDAAFWRIIRSWIREQGGGNGSSEEFEELAGRISGPDLRPFSTAW